MRYTADVIVIDSDSRVLLIERGWDPFAGHWALPGGHVDAEDDDSRAAAVRELAEETGVHVDPTSLVFVGTFDAPGRDPRGPYSTDAFRVRVPAGTAVTAADDAVSARWVPLTEVRALAFDHAKILAAALRVGDRS